jgi:hypothetical protein
MALARSLSIEEEKMPDNKNNTNNTNFDRDSNKPDKDFGRQGQGQGQQSPGRQGGGLPSEKRSDQEIDNEGDKKIGSDRSGSSDVDVRR